VHLAGVPLAREPAGQEGQFPVEDQQGRLDRRDRGIRYTWTDGGGGETTEVTYRLEPVGDGTRFTYEHTGFTGVGGLFMAQLLGRVRRKMLSEGLPTVLADLDNNGQLRPQRTLRANDRP
jgi:uncharacterized protein YndB with AHSA1/START domain